MHEVKLNITRTLESLNPWNLCTYLIQNPGIHKKIKYYV